MEKKIEGFLNLRLNGTKVVIGAGPALEALKQEYPEARFLGYRENGNLARHLASADVMVFPNRTDTFGLAMLEAMACGVPAATYPVEGPPRSLCRVRLAAPYYHRLDVGLRPNGHLRFL